MTTKRGWYGDSNRHVLSKYGSKTRSGFHLIDFKLRYNYDKAVLDNFALLRGNMVMDSDKLITKNKFEKNIEKYHDKVPPPKIEFEMLNYLERSGSLDKIYNIYEKVANTYWLAGDSLIFNMNAMNIYSKIYVAVLLFDSPEKFRENYNHALKILQYILPYVYKYNIPNAMMSFENTYGVTKRKRNIRISAENNIAKVIHDMFSMLNFMLENQSSRETVSDEKYIELHHSGNVSYITKSDFIDIRNRLISISLTLLMSPDRINRLYYGGVLGDLISFFVSHDNPKSLINFIINYLNDLNYYIQNNSSKKGFDTSVYSLSPHISKFLDILRVQFLSKYEVSDELKLRLKEVKMGFDKSDIYKYHKNVLLYPDIHDKLVRELIRIKDDDI